MTTSLSLPHALKQAILRGEATLFLGAGASKGAVHPAGQAMPLAKDLVVALADEFLGGACKDRTLEEVANFVENEYGRPRLERFIASMFKPFEPGPGHLLLPEFRWHSIFTVNYDLLVEKAYERHPDRAQTLIPFHRDQNNIDRDIRSTAEPLPYFKLHGCISHIYEPDAPLILTSETYLEYERNRRRLFTRLEDTAREYSVVFIGTTLADQHIKAILATVDRDMISRPMFYYISRGITRHDEVYLAKKRMTPICATFDQFMAELDAEASRTDRILHAAIGHLDHSIERHFRRKVSAPPGLVSFLTDNVEHVRIGMPALALEPSLLFRGQSHSWDPIEKGYDIERTIYTTTMLKALSLSSANRPPSVDVIVIRGVAGAGKTVFARRMARDLATKYNLLVLFVGQGALLRTDPLLDLYELSGLRTIMFIDQAADHLSSIIELVSRLEAASVPLLLILTDTQAGFGSDLEKLDDNTRFNVELRRLDQHEIRALLDKLTQYGCLGLLEYLSPEERFETFERLADRQLLVALYEATHGRPLEEMLLEEYNRILLSEAQELYWIVCTLNQFRVPVRAGLVHRLTRINFEAFEKRLLGPLEGIVFSSFDAGSQDYAYRARHPQIAEIVFRKVLDTETKRINQYLRIISAMNTSYSSDNEAMRQMINWRNIRDLTARIGEGRRILDAAERATAGDSHVLHQQALLEPAFPI